MSAFCGFNDYQIYVFFLHSGLFNLGLLHGTKNNILTQKNETGQQMLRDTKVFERNGLAW
jgi:hypothetical protein